MLDRVIIALVLLVVDVGASVDAQAVGDLPLQKAFLVSVPAELVRDCGAV